jgi:hypothetical protein
MVRFGNSQSLWQCVDLDGTQQIAQGYCWRISSLADISQFGTGSDYTSSDRLHIVCDVDWSEE